MLDTNPSDLEGILNKSRQTIAKHLDEDRLFSVDDVVRVATAKIVDRIERGQTISLIIKRYFTQVLEYTKDFGVERFSKYCVLGMYIHSEIVSNPVFERFITNLLADENKFVLFVCLPQKQYVQLSRWLDLFTREKGGKTASFVALPCKLVELLPIQILAEIWSEQPKLIEFNREEVFVDEANSAKALQLATALKEYGLSWQACDSIENDEVKNKLVFELNRSFYEPGKITDQDAFVHFNKKQVHPTRGTTGV